MMSRTRHRGFPLPVEGKSDTCLDQLRILMLVKTEGCRIRHGNAPSHQPHSDGPPRFASPHRHFGEASAFASEDLPVQHDVGYPSLCVPSISTSLLLRFIQYRQNGARTCTYLALLRRSDALNGCFGARKEEKIFVAYKCAAGLRAVY